MILNYNFSNFRSFADETSFSMIASSQKDLNDQLIRYEGMRILPSAVIYGANASGKSNLVLSFAIMSDLVLSGNVKSGSQNLINLELCPFIHGDTGDAPMKFELDFIHNATRYKYGFSINVSSIKRTERAIISEALYVITAKNPNRNFKPIFIRDSKSVTISRDNSVLSFIGCDKKSLELMEKQLNENLDSEHFFLSGGFKSVVSKKIADEVLAFFQDRLVVFTDFSVEFSKINIKGEFNGIKGAKLVLWNEALLQFISHADFGPQRIVFIADNSKDEDSMVATLQSEYKDTFIPSSLMESKGTIHLLKFALMIRDILQKGQTVVLDEFDSSIHPEITKGIIALFNDPVINKKGAQLIFTSHNPIFLNKNTFRRDQIRFVEKDRETYKSYIYSLADLGSEDVRNDENYLLNYFRGNYGALPFIDFRDVFTEDFLQGSEDNIDD